MSVANPPARDRAPAPDRNSTFLFSIFEIGRRDKNEGAGWWVGFCLLTRGWENYRIIEFGYSTLIPAYRSQPLDERGGYYLNFLWFEWSQRWSNGKPKGAAR